MVEGAKLCLRIKPHTHQRCLEGSNKTLCTPGPRDPTETVPELCLSVSCEGMGQQWTAAEAGALGVADLGHAVCDISLLGGPTIELPSKQPTKCRTIIPKKFSHF